MGNLEEVHLESQVAILFLPWWDPLLWPQTFLCLVVLATWTRYLLLLDGEGVTTLCLVENRLYCLRNPSRGHFSLSFVLQPFAWKGVLDMQTSSPQTVCAIIAGFLHYLFLACFFWMLVEAVMLFLMVRNLKVVNYFSSRNIKMLHLCAFGYGLPVLVVMISAALQPRGYGMHNRWVSFSSL